MQKIREMLKKITNGEWESNSRSIQTRGGTFIGYATTNQNAVVMASSQKLLELIDELHPGDEKVAARVETIFKDLK